MILDCFSSRHEPLRVRGYVFWDQKRLEEWNIPNEGYGIWVEGRSARIRKALAENPKETRSMVPSLSNQDDQPHALPVRFALQI